MVNFLKPFQVIWSGTKIVLKGIQWGLNRPEAEFACLLLPGLGFAKAAVILSTMIEAEDKFSEGKLKLSWVLKRLALLEKQGTVDLGGMTEHKITKIIQALVPIAEADGLLVAGEAE
jgi:hypothetical protein